MEDRNSLAFQCTTGLTQELWHSSHSRRPSPRLRVIGKEFGAKEAGSNGANQRASQVFELDQHVVERGLVLKAQQGAVGRWTERTAQPKARSYRQTQDEHDDGQREVVPRESVGGEKLWQRNHHNVEDKDDGAVEGEACDERLLHTGYGGQCLKGGGCLGGGGGGRKD